MSTRRTPSPTPTPTAADTVATDIQPIVAIVQQYDADTTLRPAMSKDDRKKADGRLRMCPDPMIRLVANFAQTHGGTVASLPVDATETLSLLQNAPNQEALADQLMALGQRVRDDVRSRKAQVADTTKAVHGLIRRSMKSVQPGDVAAYKQLLDGLNAEAKTVRASRSKKGAKPSATTPAATTPTQPGAPAAHPTAASPAATEPAASASTTPARS